MRTQINCGVQMTNITHNLPGFKFFYNFFLRCSLNPREGTVKQVFYLGLTPDCHFFASTFLSYESPYQLLLNKETSLMTIDGGMDMNIHI